MTCAETVRVFGVGKCLRFMLAVLPKKTRKQGLKTQNQASKVLNFIHSEK